MKVGFDAKRLFFNKTGLGVYSRLLIQGLAKYHANHDYILFAKNPVKSPFFSEFDQFKIVSGKGPLWRSRYMTNAINKQDCDLFHGLSHEIPVGLNRKKVPSVVTMHDLIFKKDSSLYPWLDRVVYDYKWKHSCRYADRIIAVSQHTKNDLIDVYRVPEEKITVVYPPLDLNYGQTIGGGAAKNLAKYNLPSTYFLYVGAINKRKNLSSILRAIYQTDEEDRIPLVIVGEGAKYEKKQRLLVKELGLSKYIIFLGHVPNQDLPTFYAQALGLVYPSYYEGFGIPIVESLLCGTPAITSNVSSMPEAGGPGVLLIDPRSPDEIAQAMQKLIRDAVLRKNLVVEGRKYIKRFGVEQICKKVESVYQELI